MISFSIYLVNDKIPTNIDRKDMLTCYNIGIEGFFFFFDSVIEGVYLFIYIYFKLVITY